MLKQEDGTSFLEQLLDQELARGGCTGPDRRLAQELAFGVVRWRSTLDWLIQRKTTGRAQKPILQTLLRLGLYQLFWLDRIPPHAAVHETVELAKQSGCAHQAGFLNAVLRGYEREREVTRTLLENLRNNDPATSYSHPNWLVTRWSRRWGMESTIQLLDWDNSPPETCIRINTLKTDAPTLLPKWQEESVEFEPIRHDWFPDNLVFQLRSHPPLATLPSFQDGACYVQDPSTLLAVEWLQPKPGETILDACAAPGGKTTYIAQRMQNDGSILAEDLDAGRLKLVEENCQRLGVTCVETRASSAEAMPESEFDRILIDAPCSNTGVMRRRVELRWRIRQEELQRLRKTQLNILRRTAPRLKPGGTLVYSTCSLEPEENRGVVDTFLTEHHDFRLDADRDLIPFRDHVDGAYVARLIRG